MKCSRDGGEEEAEDQDEAPNGGSDAPGEDEPVVDAEAPTDDGARSRDYLDAEAAARRWGRIGDTGLIR